MDSIVICTHNPTPAYFRRALRSAAIAAGRAGDCEVMVIDNASVQPVAPLAGDIAPDARVIVEQQLGLTAARRRAAKEAKGDLVVFVDDDNVIADDFILQARRLFTDPKVGVLSGQVLPEWVSPPPRWARYCEPWLAIRRADASVVSLHSAPPYRDTFPIGAGCVLRRPLLLRYFVDAEQGGWIEGRRGNELSAGEDTDIAMFALSQGFLVGSAGALQSLHIIPPGRMELDYLLRLTAGSIRSAAQVERKWSARFGTPVFGFFQQSRTVLTGKKVIYGLLSFLPTFQIRARQQAVVLECALALDSHRVGVSR